MKTFLDWKEYEKIARQMVAEGCVLLENRNQVLPLKKDCCVSVFGRMQNHYYKSGTGSGGMVNVSYVVSIPDGLRASGRLKVNEELVSVYENWEKENPIVLGYGWGQEPWSQQEMPLSEEIANRAAAQSEAAIVILARTAGEDRDATTKPGSFALTDEEMKMLRVVRKAFTKMVVLLNVGGLIDMAFVDEVAPDAVMYVWQGGMVGGLGVADLLTGKVSPSGKLPDTIAYSIEDYPSTPYFGAPDSLIYAEDIFVGYRYFETFAKEKVRYPFGFGLSYTTFQTRVESCEWDLENLKLNLLVNVENTGTFAGKEVLQVYGHAPVGKLGTAERVLIGFEKTPEIPVGGFVQVPLEIHMQDMASFDDSGVTGHCNCKVLEEGEYTIFLGNSVRAAIPCFQFQLDEIRVLEELEEALAPYEQFSRFHRSGEQKVVFEKTPTYTVEMYDRRRIEVPETIAPTGNRGIRLVDVRDGNATMEAFVAQMSDEELSCIIRGEGMGSSLVTPGTAAAFGGVSEALREMGIPAVCCDDGPSGMRLDSGAKAFSLPNGLVLGSSFNKELNEKLFGFLGLEMRSKKVDVLLGPGMNIHRHPINGRNFEYFSEDPFLTGSIAIAQLTGLKRSGVSGTVKHFCGNNQEYHRHSVDSVISQRALREIYLKGFEMAVRAGVADSVMTTYGKVNGLWTAGNYDLNTTILRREWGFDGIVMTDWWANINERGQEPTHTNFSTMVRAQNDLYMVCPNGAVNATGDNTLSSLEEGILFRGELQRCAMNICRFVMQSSAFRRMLGEEAEVEIIHQPVDPDEEAMKNVEYHVVDGSAVIDLTYKDSVGDTNYVFALDIRRKGIYDVILTGSSELSELAQLPCTLYYTGFPLHSFTFQGTGGKEAQIVREFEALERFHVFRLYVKSNGLSLKSIEFRYNRETQSEHGKDNKE